MSIKYYFLKYKHYPVKAIFNKILKKLRGKFSDLYTQVKYLFVDTHASDKRILESTQSKSMHEVIQKFKECYKPIFIKKENREYVVAKYISEDYDAFKEIIEKADTYLKHTFDLLGSGPTDLNSGVIVDGYNCIKWNEEFIRKVSYNKSVFYKNLRSKYKHKNLDIKVPWELSRLQHLIIIGQAYLLTGNEKYAIEVKNEIMDWIENNKPLFGVNWVSTMEVAIRISNMIVAYDFIKDSQCCTDDFLAKLIKSIYNHGIYIVNNLEWSEEMTHNHYVSDIVGLLFIALNVPVFKESLKWKDFAGNELVNEMDKQVYEDGSDFEASTSYHRLALELFFYSYYLCTGYGIVLPDKFKCKLYKMFDFVQHIIKPNNKIPQIGDNDNGRFLIFREREILDHTYLPCIGSIVFEEKAWKRKEICFANEALWIFGKKGKDVWDKLPFNESGITSKEFENSGFYIIRDNEFYMFISCGPNGQKHVGGHGHNDKLSFELCIGNDDFIIDTGTYLYTPEPVWRNRFRSTAFHNTLQIDGYEQSEISSRLFELSYNSQARKILWEIGENILKFRGMHIGYRKRLGIDHIREIEFDKTSCELTIKDYLEGNGAKEVSRFLHIAPGIKLNLIDGHQIKLTGERKSIILKIDDGELNIAKGNVSKSYGMITETNIIIIKNFNCDSGTILQMNFSIDRLQGQI